MKTTKESRSSFVNAVRSCLEELGDDRQWNEPAIYATIKDDVLMFDACNRPAMPEGGILWLIVEPDSFGELSGDHQKDAEGIEANCFESAVSDIEEAIERWS